MIRKIKFLPSILALLLCVAGLAFGQETGGAIEGTVKDPQGAVVPNVAVTVTNRSTTSGARPDASTGFNRTINTDANGFFRVLEVPPGFYTVTTAATAGFGGGTVTNVEVVLGKTTPINIGVAVGPQAANVTVTAADMSAIDPTDTKIQTNITAQTAELLPKGQNFSSLLKVSPATRPEPLAGGFQVDGASGSENTFIIDGQEVTNFRTGSLNTNYNLPFPLVQEVQVKSSGFEAEYGGATGGVINVVTKGGNNDYHGEFGINFRPSKFQAGPRPFLRSFRSGSVAAGTFVDIPEYFTPLSRTSSGSWRATRRSSSTSISSWTTSSRLALSTISPRVFRERPTRAQRGPSSIRRPIITTSVTITRLRVSMLRRPTKSAWAAASPGVRLRCAARFLRSTRFSAARSSSSRPSVLSRKSVHSSWTTRVVARTPTKWLANSTGRRTTRWSSAFALVAAS
jgi:hypothetical protein